MKIKCACCLLLIISTCTIDLKQAAAQQIDTIAFNKNPLNTHALKPGLQQYLVYFQNPGKKKNLRFWFWLRDIKTDNRNGEPIFTITQHWYGSDTSSYRTVYSVNRQADFAPLYHSELVNNKIKAYNWLATAIIGADSVNDNEAKAFKLDFAIPCFNWNLDIETFEMLPLSAGKTFAINFYDAGYDQPKYVRYKVTGDEVLTLLNGIRADCWKLTTEGKMLDGSVYTETYWISKKEHEFLKEEDSFNGTYRYKIKMLGAAPDLVKRFK